MAHHSNRRGSAVLRKLGLDENPLRRGSDRIQSFSLLVIGLFIVLGCVLGVRTGLSVYEHERQVEIVDARDGYQVMARVLEVSTSVPTGREGATTAHITRVTWQDEQGREHMDTITVRKADRPHGDIRLWIDARGTASASPRSAGRTLGLAFMQGLGVTSWTAIAAAVAYVAICALLNLRRRRQWDDEWVLVEPQWRRQVL
ncbi:MAG: hypothetical protein GEV10_14485 [Streptosporangiales bacterium]|nr:hypothetical protein [Streptosporangiales bacterium]